MDRIKTGRQNGERGLLVQVVQALRKPAENYQRKYCHPAMHPVNYHVVRNLRLSHEEVDRITSRNAELLSQIKSLLAARGVRGEVYLQLNPGGPGRRRFSDMTEGYIEWLAAHKPKRIATLQIGREYENDGGYWRED